MLIDQQPNVLEDISEQQDLAIVDLSGYTQGEIEALASAALFFARETRKEQIVDELTPDSLDEARLVRQSMIRQSLIRIRTAVFMAAVSDVLRMVRERKAEEAKDEAGAF